MRILQCRHKSRYLSESCNFAQFALVPDRNPIGALISFHSILTLILLSTDAPDDVFERGSNLILTELHVLECVSGGLGEFHHRHLRRHLENLHRHRQLPLPPLRFPLHPHLVILLPRDPVIQLLRHRLQLLHHRRRRELRQEHRRRSPPRLEQAPQIKPVRQGGDDLERVVEWPRIHSHFLTDLIFFFLLVYIGITRLSIENHAAGPDIRLRPVVAFLLQHLRRHVRRRPARRDEHPVRPALLRQRRQPEVGNLEILVLVEEEILRLQIPMRDVAAVAEIDGADELLEVLPRDVFPELPLGDLGEELAASDVLHDEEDLGLGGHDFLELDDVGMADQAHDGDLLLDLPHEPLFILELLLLDDLDGHALVGHQVPPVVDLREVPLPEEPPHLLMRLRNIANWWNWARPRVVIRMNLFQERGVRWTHNMPKKALEGLETFMVHI
ncbi:hypothetical protein G2W53_028469 [Senna tora]|uniref:Uncharacterized protein n=1 Tax=Senna tora TaxID=362788 RepID=A0A834T4G3_9FABA|nr:hypothetical protein G2W53_028469 [Senna tora]